MALTVTAARNAKPSARPFKLYDEKGLFLLVHPNGSKYWRLRYRIADRERLLALGLFPSVLLTEAREKARKARALVKEGRDPIAEQHADRAANRAQTLDTFRVVADEWQTRNAGRWSPTYAEKVRGVLSAHVCPRIGSVPVSDADRPNGN